MEGAGHAEFSADAVRQPDLLEIYADQQVTIFGVSGTVAELAAMCPVDLDDPRIGTDAKNEFVVKAMNEAGSEIREEHEGLFAQVTDRQGLERKFTVSVSQTEDGVGRVAKLTLETHQQSVVSTRPDASHGAAHKEQILQTELGPERRIATGSVTAVTVAEHTLRTTQVTEKFDTSRELLPAPTASAPARRHVIEYVARVAETEARSGILAVLSPEAEEAGTMTMATDGSIAMIEDEPIRLDFKLPGVPVIAESPAAIGEVDDMPISFEEVDVPHVAHDFVAVFTSALHASIEERATLEGVPDDDSELGTPAGAKGRETQSLLVAVVERLEHLNPLETETADLLLRDIVDTAQLLQEIDGATDDMAAAPLIDRLQDECRQLLEILGVNGDDEAAQQFTAAILRIPNLYLLYRHDALRYVREDEGTHEAKRRLAALGLIGRTRVSMERLLGMLALFYDRPALFSSVALE